MNVFIKIWQVLKKSFLAFGGFMQKVVNTILFTVVYFIGIGLTSLFMKLFGKKFLELSPTKEQDSYYKECTATKRSKEDFFRLY